MRASSWEAMRSFSRVERIDSNSPNSSRMSLWDMPRACSRVVTDCLRLRSMRTPTWSRLSTSNSSQAPREGMTLAEKMCLSEVLSIDSSKYTPGERTSCETTTRSVPLMMKVPLSVMSGNSPMKTVWVLISPVSLFMNSAMTYSGAA